MDTVSKDLPIAIFIGVSIKKESLMGKEGTLGQMDHHMKEGLLKDAVMDKETGNLREWAEIFTSGRMSRIKNVAMVDMYGQMAASTKENLRTI